MLGRPVPIKSGINVYTGMSGVIVLFFCMAGLFLLGAAFFWGIAQLATYLLPVLTVFAYSLILVFMWNLGGKRFFAWKEMLTPNSVLMMSQILGLVTWMTAFLFVMNTFGWGGIILALLFSFFVPIAVIGALFKGAWFTAGHICVWMSFAHLMKTYVQGQGARRNFKKDNIIDVDIVS